MNYSININKRNGITFYILQNESNGEYAEIIPDLGATVNKLCLFTGNKVKNILFCDEDNELHRNPLFRGRLLFPYNDAIPGGLYTFNNIQYAVDINSDVDNLAMHGFIYNKKFYTTEKECSEDNCSVSFQFTLDKKLGDF